MIKKLFIIAFFFYQISFSQTDSISLYYKKGEFRKAISYGELIISYYHDNKITKDEGFINTLSWLATLSDTDNDTIKREKYYKLLEENINIYGDNYKSIIQNYYLIGKNYKTKLKFDLAEDYFKKAISLSELNNFEEEVYFSSLQLLGQIYSDQEKITFYSDKTKKIFDKQLLTSEKLYTKNSFDYAFSLTNLGLYFNQNENYFEAENNFLKSLSIIESLPEINEKYHLAALDNISKFYQNIHQLSKADFYNQKGLDIILKKEGKKHEEYLNFLSNKALIKSELGDYDLALNIYDECIDLAKEIYGVNSTYFGTMISNVANILLEKKDFKNAEKLYLVDYDITKKRYGENHFQTAMCLNRLSNVYCSLNEYNKAIEYNLKALNIIENSLGQENSFYATICSTLSTQYSLINNFKYAEKYSLKSYNLKLKLDGQKSASRITNLSNLTTLYGQYDDVENQKKYLLEYLELLRVNLLEMYSNFSQNELLNYFKKILPNNTYLSVLNFYPTQYPEINIGCYENELLVKNLSLRNQQRIKNSIQKSGDAILQNKYEKFVANKSRINKLDELPIDKRPQDYEQLKTDTEVIEKDLTRQSSAFADAKKALSITWKQVQNKLEPNEIAIDIVAYNYYNKKWTDSIVYAAFVVKKEFKSPRYIQLFEQKQLTFLLARNKNQQDSINISNHYTDKAISDLFLKPLANELKGCVTVYLSPSGLGHQIDFSALPVSETQTLGEKYQVHVLGSTSELVNYQVTSLNKKDNLELLLYGGIDYNKSSSKDKINVVGFEPDKHNLTDLATRSGITDFGYLGGTNTEVEQIKSKAAKNGFATTVFNEREATEESIKQLDGRTTPYVLHLATHGFFFPDPKQELPKEQLQFSAEITKAKIYQTSDDPMMRSGLLFAGANKYWGKPTENINVDDGILTANEISNLDLSACQLVVLSACETGLGTINGSEGVFGLQRAFKMAGVKNIIMSLWKVPDAQTAQLFDIFYKECLGGKSIHEAFQIAQSKMRDKYSPYYWAGFVLLE